MLIGARLNWLLSHGKGKTWGAPGTQKFIQIDIDPKEMDSNIEIAAPLVGDIKILRHRIVEWDGRQLARASDRMDECNPRKSRDQRRAHGTASAKQQRADGFSMVRSAP